MFCPKCGKNLPDNAAFCDGCGARIAAAAPAQAPAQAPVQAPVQAVAPAQPNPLLDNTINAIKGLFSKEPGAAVEKASKSSGLEWLILFGITAFFNMLYYAISPLHYSGNFDALGLVEGLLSAGIWFFGISVGILLMFKLMYNQDVELPKIFNLTAVAMLPLGGCYLLNMIFGFVWSGLTSTISGVAVIAFALLLYLGVQKLGNTNGSLLFGLLAVFAFVYLADAGISALWAEITTPSMGGLYGGYSDYADYAEDMLDSLF